MRYSWWHIFSFEIHTYLSNQILTDSTDRQRHAQRHTHTRTHIRGPTSSQYDSSMTTINSASNTGSHAVVLNPPPSRSSDCGGCRPCGCRRQHGHCIRTFLAVAVVLFAIFIYNVILSYQHSEFPITYDSNSHANILSQDELVNFSHDFGQHLLCSTGTLSKPAQLHQWLSGIHSSSSSSPSTTVASCIQGAVGKHGLNWKAVEHWTPVTFPALVSKHHARGEQYSFAVKQSEFALFAYWGYEKERFGLHHGHGFSDMMEKHVRRVHVSPHALGQLLSKQTTPDHASMLHAKTTATYTYVAADIADVGDWVWKYLEPHSDWFAPESDPDASGGPSAAAYDRNMYTSLWIGNAGSSTQAHIDLATNVFVQLHGCKDFVLFTPAAIPALRFFPFLHPLARKSQLELASQPSDSLSFHRKQSAITDAFHASERYMSHVRVCAGDALFIPPMTVHHVHALEDSVSISFFAPSHEERLHDDLLHARLPFDGNASATEMRYAIALFGCATGMLEPSMPLHLASRYYELHEPLVANSQQRHQFALPDAAQLTKVCCEFADHSFSFPGRQSYTKESHIIQGAYDVANLCKHSHSSCSDGKWGFMLADHFEAIAVQLADIDFLKKWVRHMNK
jgi:Cupin-like domain